QRIEDDASEPMGWLDIEIEGRSKLEISYNVKQLEEAGLITAIDISTSDGFDVRPKRLTWKGHEFLDAVRNDTIWHKAKEVVMEKAGGLAFDLVRETAKGLIEGALRSL